MFEQSVLSPPHTRITPAFLLVTAAELVAIAGAAVIPLFFTPPLIEPQLPVVLRFARAVILVRLDPAKAARASKSEGPTFTRPRPFYAPQRIPRQVATAPDKTLAMASAPNVQGAFNETGSAVPGALDQLGVAPPPPPSMARPATGASGPVRVTSSVQAAKLINKVVPSNPPLARQTRQFGKVRLVATIGKDGRVKQIQVLSGPAFLVPAAVEAVRQWVYQPTLLNGKAVEVIAPIDINFILNQ